MKVARILTYKSCRQVLHSSIRYKISSFLDNFVHFFHFFFILDNFVHFFIGFGHFFTCCDNFVHFFSFLVIYFCPLFFHFWTTLSTFLSGLDNFVQFFIGFGHFVLGHLSLSTFFSFLDN